MQTVLQDLRYYLRQTVRNPGSTLTAIISLALGIGATTAVFSVVYAALINPYPYPAADRIVRLAATRQSGEPYWVNLNGEQIQQLRKAPVVESVLAMDFHALTLSGRDVPENVNGVGLISTGFSDLGVPPLLGRGLLPSDAIDGQDPQSVVLLSYKFWEKHFFGDPDVLGKTLQLDHKNYQIVGVADPRFTWYTGEVFLPLKLMQGPEHLCVVDIRLKPGITPDVANASLQPLVDQFARDMPKEFPKNLRVKVEGLNEWVNRSIRGTLYLLFGAVALLLAIGCGNVSILLLARGTARQHELAVRAAVGAHRRRIIRQLLTEALLLSATGAGLGVALSYGILAGIRTLLPRYAFAPEVVININIPVLLFSIAVALLTGVLFGLWPALQLSRAHVGEMSQSNPRRMAGSVQGRKIHNSLIAGQIALTLLLLAGAGSAMEGFMHMLQRPLGYDPHNVMSVAIPLHDNSYPSWEARASYFEQLREKIAEMPGVAMTAISTDATPPRSGWNSSFEILGQPADERRTASIQLVNQGYFPVLRIKVREGRIWNEAETRDGAHVAVINQTLAQRYFPNGDSLGRSVKVSSFGDRPPEVIAAPNINDSWLQIVGVVDDVLNNGLRAPVKPAIFVPYTLNMGRGTEVLVRSGVNPLSMLRGVQSQIATVNPDQQTYSEIEDLENLISDEPEWQQEHLVTWIFGVFAWLALVLAAVGLYSVVSYTVAQRTNEFGIRMALGAKRGHVLRIVFASTFWCVAGGIVIGLGLTLAMNRLLARWIEGTARDPFILLAGAVLMALVAGIACAIPARQASEVDPMTALRCE
jgi:predicted permease